MLHAEIGVGDGLAVEPGRRGRQHDAAFAQAQHPVGEGHGAPQVLLDVAVQQVVEDVAALDRLGDEGSGANLGIKTLQYYLYNTFDADLMERFIAKYNTTAPEILESVYKKPLPNRYLARYVEFLAENRGHYMVENIIEDSFNNFFFSHICKYTESWTMPIHFIGSVAFGFKDVLKEMCRSYELQLGRVMKNPMDGLVHYHSV